MGNIFNKAFAKSAPVPLGSFPSSTLRRSSITDQWEENLFVKTDGPLLAIGSSGASGVIDIRSNSNVIMFKASEVASDSVLQLGATGLRGVVKLIDSASNSNIVYSDGAGILALNAAYVTPTAVYHLSPKQYVDDELANIGTLSGNNVTVGAQDVAGTLSLMAGSAVAGIILANGNFGIGATSPVRNFEIEGSGNVETSVKSTTGSVEFFFEPGAAGEAFFSNATIGKSTIFRMSAASSLDLQILELNPVNKSVDVRGTSNAQLRLISSGIVQLSYNPVNGSLVRIDSYGIGSDTVWRTSSIGGAALDTISMTLKADGQLLLPVLKSGTLAAPPGGLVSGELWEDTTDDATDPIVRIRA